MAARLPSVGDVLILSQLAWRIGRCFSAPAHNGRPPADFARLEADINSLSKGLKLLAETLFADAAVAHLSRAAPPTLAGLAVLVLACQKTLHDLDSFVDQYQVIRRHRTDGGYSVERGWSDLVLRNYRTMIWTAEGGTLQALHHLLAIHVDSIAIARQAFQSKWLLGLEKTIALMAPKVEVLHQDSVHTLNDRIAEATRVMTAIAKETPWIRPSDDSRRPSTLNLDADPSLRDSSSLSDSYQLDRVPRNFYQLSPSGYSSDIASPRQTRQRSQSDANSTVSSFSQHSMHGSVGHIPLVSPLVSRESSRRYATAVGTTRHATVIDTPIMDFSQIASSVASDSLLPHLPPPQLPLDDDISPAMSTLSISPHIEPHSLANSSSSSVSFQDSFEREVFKNSAILCDVVGSEIEYTLVADPNDNPYGIEVVKAMSECRICIVRKRELDAARNSNANAMTTSIWAFSRDGTVRMQQKLVEGQEYVPYSSYFSPEKISVTVPTELIFHPKVLGSTPMRRAHTSWVNYVFNYKSGASQFQNELMGLTLIATFKTTRTLRIHEGLTSVLSYQEQLCGMENMRIWETDNGAGAGIIAMIHFSAHFRNGYLFFYLNSVTEPVRIKDEGGREVKIKGLRIPIDEKGRGANIQRKDSGAGDGGRKNSASSEAKRWITGVKIEFAHEVEKQGFLKLVKETLERTTGYSES